MLLLLLLLLLLRLRLGLWGRRLRRGLARLSRRLLLMLVLHL
jgi:hypothetical protein